MDTEIKRKNPRLRKFGLIAAGVIALSGCIVWAIITSGTSSHHTDASGILIGEVTEGNFDDFIRITGRVETGTIVQVSALETGIVDKNGWKREPL